MSEENLLSELRKMGFDAEWVPIIKDRTGDFFKLQDDKKLVRWWHIIPEYEKTEDEKRALEELREQVSQFEAVHMEKHDEDEEMNGEDEEMYNEDE
jgi:hypothetical protein